MKFFLFSLSFFSLLSATGVVVPDAYLISDDKKSTYVYGGGVEGVMADMKHYQEKIVHDYEKKYGIELDDKLYVGLATDNNQIANGFSTQIPFNAQLFYGAGSGLIDYFCVSSWLKTLIIHETAHNFQLNPKENRLSQIGHKVFGNTPFAMIGVLPLFPIPNETESSFILEGNAVMNESRYGNGGRLFSGYALAEVVALAKAGEITPELMYNTTFRFPYGEKFYLVGGFFHQFLVERYGIKRVNGYFKTYATQPFPFFTNSVFMKQYGKDFETLLAEFVEEVKEKHEAFTQTEGRVVATSQLFTPLNADEKEIYTLVGDRLSAPKVLHFLKESREVRYEKGSWRGGEVFKREDAYVVQSSARTSPTTIEMGLFSENGELLKDEGSRVVQGFMPDGREVYFDVPRSIENPHLYVAGEFYGETHSSVHVSKKGDLYYFKQEGERRTLYRNKQALFDHKGHYGFVTDVDEQGGIYFIASSEHGSTAYRFFNGQTQRVTRGDDVIELKLLSDTEALVVTLGVKGYSYRVTTLHATQSEPFYRGVLSNKTSPLMTLQPFGKGNSRLPLVSKEYHPLTQLHYSSLSKESSYSSSNGFGLDLQAHFSDPLMQNNLAMLLSYNKQRFVGGLEYDNQENQLEFGGALFGVHHNSNGWREEERAYGVEGYLRLPFLAEGYWRADTTLAYTKAYDNLYREPLSLSLNLRNAKQYAMSKYPNELNSLSLMLTRDRENHAYGFNYSFMHDMPWQSFVGFKGLYRKSNGVDSVHEKGVEIRDGFSSLQSDEAILNMPSIDKRLYAKEAKMAEISLAKVFDGSLYLYSFPLSLQRESLYVKQRFYDIDFEGSLNNHYQETTVGIAFDLLFLHNNSIPLNLEWIHNEDVKDKEKVRVLFGVNL